MRARPLLPDVVVAAPAPVATPRLEDGGQGPARDQGPVRPGPAPAGAAARSGEFGTAVSGRLVRCRARHVVSLLLCVQPGDLPAQQRARRGVWLHCAALGTRSESRTAPPGGRQPRSRVRCPGDRDSTKGGPMAHTAPVQDWATDFDVLDPRYVSRPVQHLGRPAPELSRSRTPTGARAAGCPPATTTSPPLRTTSRTSARSRWRSSPATRTRTPTPTSTGPNLEYGLPPISADPPLHTWTRRLLLPWFSHQRVDSYVPLTRELCRGLLDRFADKGQRRCRRRLRAADPGAGHRPDPRRLHRPVRHLHRLGARRPRVRRRSRAAPARGRGPAQLLPGAARGAPPEPGRRPAERAAHDRGRRAAGRRRHRARHGGPRPDRRGGHDLERHRLLAVAPGRAPRRPQAPGGRARARCRPPSRSSCGPTRR